MVSLDSCHRAARYSSFQIKKRSPRSHNTQRIKRKRKDVSFFVGGYTATLYVMVNVVKRGRCAPPPLPAWANFSIMMEWTSESGRCHSMCTLRLKLFFSYSCVLSGVPYALHRGEIARFGEDTVLAKPLQQRGVQSGLRFPVAAADVGRAVLPPEVMGRAAARAAAAVPRFGRSAAGGHSIFGRVQKDLEQEKNQLWLFPDMNKNHI